MESISEDQEAPVLRQDNIRKKIATEYKPLFQKNRNGVPKKVLRNYITTRTSISARRVLSILDHADVDMNGKITEEEFVQQMSCEDAVTLRRLARGKRFLNYAVRVVEPRVSYHPKSDVDRYIFKHWGEDESIDNFVQAYDCKPPPLFIPIISFIQISYYIYCTTIVQSDSLTSVPRNNTLAYEPMWKQEAWRYLSYIFLHGNSRHLIFNLVYQLILGMLLELVHKAWRVAIIYFLGVFSGVLLHALVLNRGLVGASGGCYALIGAHIANVVINWDVMQDGWTASLIKFISSAVFRVLLLAVFGVLDVSLMINDNIQTETPVVSSYAHIGGLISGFCVGVPVLRNIDIKPWEKILFLITLLIYVALLTIGVVIHIVQSQQNP